MSDDVLNDVFLRCVFKRHNLFHLFFRLFLLSCLFRFQKGGTNQEKRAHQRDPVCAPGPQNCQRAHSDPECGLQRGPSQSFGGCPKDQSLRATCNLNHLNTLLLNLRYQRDFNELLRDFRRGHTNFLLPDAFGKALLGQVRDPVQDLLSHARGNALLLLKLLRTETLRCLLGMSLISSKITFTNCRPKLSTDCNPVRSEIRSWRVTSRA